LVEKSYIDVNVFVYWLGGHPVYGDRAKEWVDAVARSSRGVFFTSSLTFYEVAVILAGLTGMDLKNVEFVEKLASAFRELRGLEVVDLESRDHASAIELMKKYMLDLEDALHLSVALRAGARRMVSNDADFDRTPLTRVF